VPGGAHAAIQRSRYVGIARFGSNVGTARALECQNIHHFGPHIPPYIAIKPHLFPTPPPFDHPCEFPPLQRAALFRGATGGSAPWTLPVRMRRCFAEPGPHHGATTRSVCRRQGVSPMRVDPHGRHTGVSPGSHPCLAGPAGRGAGRLDDCNSRDVSNLQSGIKLRPSIGNNEGTQERA
jgi:hypothetical protein